MIENIAIQYISLGILIVNILQLIAFMIIGRRGVQGPPGPQGPMGPMGMKGEPGEPSEPTYYRSDDSKWN